MTKQQKVFLGLGLLAVGAIAFVAFRPKATPPVASNETPTDGSGAGTKCPAGQVACANDPSKCYDPDVQYIINPCPGKGIFQI